MFQVSHDSLQSGTVCSELADDLHTMDVLLYQSRNQSVSREPFQWLSLVCNSKKGRRGDFLFGKNKHKQVNRVQTNRGCVELRRLQALDPYICAGENSVDSKRCFERHFEGKLTTDTSAIRGYSMTQEGYRLCHGIPLCISKTSWPVCLPLMWHFPSVMEYVQASLTARQGSSSRVTVMQ